MRAPTLSLQSLEDTLRAQFAPTQLKVLDESAAHAGHVGNPDGTALSHVRIRLQSAEFAGLRTLAQHRLVYAALAPYFALGLHAVVLETSA